MIDKIVHAIFGHKLYPVSFKDDIYRDEIALIVRSRVNGTVEKTPEIKKEIARYKKVEVCHCGFVRAQLKSGDIINFYI